MERVNEIRKRIKLTRLKKEYTQGYVAQRLNMSQMAYHKLENGKTTLKVKMLIELAKVLEVEESYLLGCDA